MGRHPMRLGFATVGDERVGVLTDERLDRVGRAAARLGGTWWTKVPLAGPGTSGWVMDAPDLFIDAVWLPDGAESRQPWSADPAEFLAQAAASSQVTSVVCRGYADRTAFGLLVAAQDLLPLSVGNCGAVGGLALVDENRDEANMRWAYHRRGFEVLELEGDGS
jgi:hypothetical protein